MPTVSSLLNWLGSQDQNLDVVNEKGESPAFTRRGDKMVVTFPDATLLESTKTFHEITEAEAGDVDVTTEPNEPVPGSPASPVPNKAAPKADTPPSFNKDEKPKAPDTKK